MKPNQSKFQSAQFEDVPIVPFQVRIDRNNEWRHQGGPIWPDWDKRRFERYCRDFKPIDHEPDLKFETRPIEIGQGTWCGPIINWHFGHQIADFSMRIMPAKFSGEEKFIFSPVVDDVPAWFFDILKWFSISQNETIFLKSAAIVKDFSVFEQAEQLWSSSPSTKHLDLMDDFIAKKSLRISENHSPIYVSRAGLPKELSSIGGEKAIEIAIARSGGRIFRPERHSLTTQIMTYLSATHLIFAEGSAAHVLQLLGRIPGTVTVLIRRPHKHFGVGFLKPRAKGFVIADAISHFIYGILPTGEINWGRTFTFLDSEKLMDRFDHSGFSIRENWNASFYKEQVKNDLKMWIDGNIKIKNVKNNLLIIEGLIEAGYIEEANYVLKLIKNGDAFGNK